MTSLHFAGIALTPLVAFALLWVARVMSDGSEAP